ncbi:NAD-dependent epimerase/dehydratase family protein [Halomarina oriensis]|uniref:NAD-dependent epimerase/dehydratase family protein n=1 Tax=Halomarina oriensis TaxID=671145 RepID=A0A6B0GIC3_9EURY|nr:NAD-dependent epimerase/dehydratase family protein [Halomarina oriensis]MWG33189.1 NAD-dependent epimerase/dehydratase family protein [Halomarina oriensis]
MEIAGRTVLVTGGAGFIGSHLVDALVGENEVRVLDDFSTGSEENCHRDATVVRGDVCDSRALDRAMDGVDLVFHEAANASVTRSVDDPVESHRINSGGTLGLFERAREEDARVVVASSTAIYGDPTHVPVTEDEPTTPQSPYGVEKLATDHYARLYYELYGLETVALRYFNVYGPRQAGGEYSGVITAFLEQACAGQDITVEGDGSQIRDFVHVSDVVQANLLAATTDHVGEGYNVGTGRSVSILDLAELIRDLSGSRSEIVHIDERPGDIRASRADISKAREHLSFEPTVSLREGLGGLVRQPAR